MHGHHSSQHPRNVKRIAAHIALGAVLVTAVATVFGYAVMLLWNAVLPNICSARPLSYWQAVGLLVLCRLLVGRFHPSHGSSHGWHGRRCGSTEPEEPSEKQAQTPAVDEALDRFVERGR